MFKPGDKVRFGNVGGKGKIVSEGAFEAVVKFDDGDVCRVDVAFLSRVPE